jgi:hypothetical protein
VGSEADGVGSGLAGSRQVLVGRSASGVQGESKWRGGEVGLRFVGGGAPGAVGGVRWLGCRAPGVVGGMRWSSVAGPRVGGPGGLGGVGIQDEYAAPEPAGGRFSMAEGSCVSEAYGK